jgi:hypothetical protein
MTIQSVPTQRPFSADVFSSLPREVIDKVIFHKLPLPALGTCCLVCSAWGKIAQEQINSFTPPNAFGPKEWYTYFGCRFTAVPRLPHNIVQMLRARSLFTRRKIVAETEMLVFIPKTVNGGPLNIKLFQELAQKPLQGNPVKFARLDLGQYTDCCVAESHWVLMPRNAVSGCLDRPFAKQQAFMKTKTPYEVSTILVTTICFSVEIISKGEIGTLPYLTPCRVQEKYANNLQLIISTGFSYYEGVSRPIFGLSISRDYIIENPGEYESNGVMALRRL